MSGFSLNTINSALAPRTAAAEQKLATKTTNLGADQDAKELLDLQSAKTDFGVSADLQATLTQQFNKNTGAILDKMA
jgi:hypothetical protein